LPGAPQPVLQLQPVHQITAFAQLTHLASQRRPADIVRSQKIGSGAGAEGRRSLRGKLIVSFESQSSERENNHDAAMGFLIPQK
jgi:hypothetical protein